MDKIDLPKHAIVQLANSVSRVIKTALVDMASTRARKAKRKTSYEKVKNFVLDKSIAEPVLQRLSVKPKHTLDDQDNYQFSRAVFYKSLAALMKTAGIKSHRSNFYGHLSGEPDDVNSFYDMISPDYVNGPITNQSLHVYMSDMSRKCYHELVKRIHAADSTSADSVEHGTHVLITLLATVKPQCRNSFKIMDQEYDSPTLPLPLLSFLTKQPLTPDVVAMELDQNETDNIDSHLCERFIAKFEKLVTNCHLMYTLDVETNEHRQLENTTLKVEYDQPNRSLRLRINAPVTIVGFRLGSTDSFKKIATMKDREFVIPEGMTHVFISCKNADHCICGKIVPDDGEATITVSETPSTTEHTENVEVSVA